MPLLHWCIGVMWSVEGAFLPVPLVWILCGVAGLVVGPDLRPWGQNADLAGLGIRDVVLRPDCRGAIQNSCTESGPSYSLMAWAPVTLGTILMGLSFPNVKWVASAALFMPRRDSLSKKSPYIKESELVSG